MSWRVEFAPQVELDVAAGTGMKPASRRAGPQICRLWSLEDISYPMLNCRRHASKDIRWCLPESFPYRVIYEVNEPGIISADIPRLPVTNNTGSNGFDTQTFW